MKQMTFADAEYAGKRKQTRKELFLIEMDQVVPWKGLIALIEPFYPWGEGGRPAYPLTAMLRIHLLQNWFGYSDPAMEEALYETTILRQFAGLGLERIPDETTILNFRRLLGRACGWRADIYWRMQKRCTCNVEHGRCEGLATAKNGEMSGSTGRF
ncbi:hypothetical protein CSC45_4422 [Pseudomonas aeruginosa]|nr:hypothetical protein CSC45_4422 [Pseudomonas aeruginosa]